MARPRRVTRYMKMTSAEVLVINTKTEKTSIETIEVSEAVEGDALLKKCRAKRDTEEEKVIKVKSFTHTRKLYGMLEDDFLKYAKVMEKR